MTDGSAGLPRALRAVAAAPTIGDNALTRALSQRDRSDYAGFDTFRRLATIIVAVHTRTALARLQLCLGALLGDPRLAIEFTRVPDQLGDGVDEALRAAGAKVISWDVARSRSFDLAIAASPHQVRQLTAAKKIVVPHGCGYNKLWQRWNWPGKEGVPPTFGLDRMSMLKPDGTPIFDAVLLTHDDQFAIVHDQCPEIADRAFVGGDIAYDSLLANPMSPRSRRRLRRRLGVRRWQKLLVLASTFGPDSLLCRHRDALPRLVKSVAPDHRVVLVLHSAVWAQHGRAQVLANLGPARAAGLTVVAPGEDWRALALAADAAISDASSFGLYAAAVGVPVLLTSLDRHVLDPRSGIAELARLGPILDPGRPLRRQLARARSRQPWQREIAARRVSSRPGQAAELLRAKVYAFLELDAPDHPGSLPPITAPALIGPRAANRHPGLADTVGNIRTLFRFVG